MTSETLFNELTETTLRTYFNAGDVDKITFFNNVESALRPFGKFNSILVETVLHVKNFTANVPDFIQLVKAYRCDPVGYEGEKEKLVSSRTWKERYEKDFWHTSCDPCCEKEGVKYVKEDVYEDGYHFKFYYKPVCLLSLGNKMKQDKCVKGCENLFSRAENNISIDNDTLTANFKEGKIFIEYLAFERDENNSLIIPDTPKRYGYEYTKAYVLWKFFEEMWTSGDDPNTIQKMQYWEAQKRKFFSLLDQEYMSSAMSDQAFIKLKRKQLRDYQVYRNQIPYISR